MHLLKFQRVRPAAAVLGRMLAETVANLEQTMPVGTLFCRTIAVVPVPLHTRKQAQRGFKRALMIARGALKQLSRPQRFDLCTYVLPRHRQPGTPPHQTRHLPRE